MAIKKNKSRARASSNGNRPRNGSGTAKGRVGTTVPGKNHVATTAPGRPAERNSTQTLRTYSIPDLRLEHPNFTGKQATEKIGQVRQALDSGRGL